MRRCTHGDTNRSWISTYSSVDYAYAASLNYAFFFHEIAIFSGHERLLEAFVSAMLLESLQHSEYPKEVVSAAEKEMYLRNLNEEMRFPSVLGGEKLSVENMQPDRHLRRVWKGRLNSFLGEQLAFI